MFATQVLPETGFEVSLDENESEIVGILTVGNDQHEIKKGENKIGRDSTICAIVLDNFTVSKLHAVIESEGSDDTFIYDVGSTNQTKLGKKSLKPHCRYKLDNGSIITLGNVVGRFMLPFDGNNDCLKTETITPPNSDGRTYSSVYNGYDELDDIFEVPTQVTIPQPGTSKQFSKFKELQDVFKVPKILPVAKGVNSSLQMMENCFDVVTQCQLYSQKSPTEVSNSFQENTDIFNLSTQCPVSSALLNEGHECNNKTDNDLDKIKSLLNDGQDDILCTFMSLHSPNGQNQSDIMKPEEIKTELLSQDFDDILNASTQVNAEFMEEKLDDETQKKELNVKNNNFIEEFSLDESQIETIYIQNEKPKSEDSQEKGLQPKEEDLISTQELPEKVTSNVITCTNAVEDKSESESYLEITLNDFSITDQINNGEDLILAQESTVSEKQDASPVVAKLGSCQEDLISTQPYVVNVEKVNEEIKKESEDADSYLEVTLDSIQTSKGDFINTKVPVIPKKTEYQIENNEHKVFEANGEIETTQLDETSAERDDDDDDDSQDFIATQTFEPLMRNKSKAHRRTFRECSPDILVPAKSPENFCITANLPDLISTQNFGTSECKYRVAELSERINSEREHMCNDELVLKDIHKFSVSESSGDETESDLEIIMDTIQTPQKKFCLDEGSISVLTKVEISSESPQPKSCQDDDDSNSSYIFQPELQREDENVRKYSEMDKKRRQEVAASDSDATDCDELEMVSVKPEPLKMVQYEETQVLTLSLPSNFAEKESDPNDDWMIGKESPRFEPEKESVWILEESQNGELGEISRNKNGKPTAQKLPLKKEENENETWRRKEIEIRIDNLVGRITRSKSKSLGTATASHSPLKRVGESKNAETPFKKSKTFDAKQSTPADTSGRCLRNSERRFSKLWEAHDIAQIQPTRTRNSRKSEDKINDADKSEKNVITEVKTSYRKSRSKRGDTKMRNTDIPSYFSRK